MSVSDDVVKELVAAARAAHAKAYVPYSHFAVGAAVLLSDDTVFSGCNVENASYGLTICAERNAVFQAIAAGRTDIKAVLVYTSTPEPTAPCGACRQVIAEFAADAEIISICDGPDVIRMRIDVLLPEMFGHRNMRLSG